MKQLLVLSGKGGTGKTTIASALIKLSNANKFADCDVDAPNLHLVNSIAGTEIKNDFYGLSKAIVDTNKCTKCGSCFASCKFDAISFEKEITINPFSCEGCGVCEWVCKKGAITLVPSVAGELTLFSSDEKIFSTATLKMGSGTSGKLVSEVKKQLDIQKTDEGVAIIDGSPGIGCPVIASIGGVDTVLVVAEPTLSGISDLERIVKTANRFDVKILVCVNKYDVDLSNTERIEDFCKTKNLEMIGKIPYDREAIKAINSGKTIVEVDCIAGNAIKNIYRIIKEKEL